MGRMRRIPARIRFAPRTGLRKNAVAPRRCMWRWHFYNRSSAVFCDASHVGTCQWRMVFCDAPHVGACQWRMFFCDAPHVGACQWRMFFCDAPHVGAYRWMVVLSTGDGNPMTKATAEERLYNHSPRLACLPGVSCGRRIYRRRAVV